MYGHIVIENLITLQKKSPMIWPYNSLIESIKSAQHFHFNEIRDGLEMIPSSLRERFDGMNSLSEILFQKEWGGNIRLPYRSCWFDCILQNKLKKSSGIQRLGFLCEECWDPKVIKVVPFYFAEPKHPKHDFKGYKLWGPDIYQWLVSIDKPLSEYKENFLQIPTKNFHTTFYPFLIANTKALDPDVGPISSPSADYLFLLNWMLIILGCRNVITQKTVPSKELNIKRIKRKKQPLFTYHTLHIKIPTKQTEPADESYKTGRTMRLHMCRGHFKYYTEKKPLFGKYLGWYWWQPHVRGNKKNGIVMKDYDVTTDPESDE